LAGNGTQTGLILNTTGKIMHKQNDIATFPELFDGMEQFLDEQLTRLKHAGLWSISLALGGGLMAAWLLERTA